MSIERKRRQLLQGLAALAGLGVVDNAHAARGVPLMNPSGGRPVVARARRDGVIDARGVVDRGKLEAMLGGAVARAAGTASPREAFGRLFRPSDVVGIKVGTLAGPGLSPHPEVAALLAGWLQQAGVAANKIIIWDRTDGELERAGFPVNRSETGVRCLGTNQDYDWTPREWGAGGSCFARMLLYEMTALISVGVMKDHDLAGISAGMKNWYGAIHNPNKQHANGCDPQVAYLAAYPPIRNKLRLTVVDGLVAQCQGGPARSPRWAWPYQGVLASLDPVAIDAIAWKIIEERRHELGLKTLVEDQREPKWIASAARLGLGENRVEHIDLVDT